MDVKHLFSMPISCSLDSVLNLGMTFCYIDNALIDTDFQS